MSWRSLAQTIAKGRKKCYHKGMTYEEVTLRLDALSKKGSVYGTERVERLLKKIGSPDQKLHIVHVAGTNGKGSTATMLSSILQEAGYRTGLFTSPAVFDRRECYLVNGSVVDKARIADCFSRVLALAEDTTAFETEFCCALSLFAEEGCDYAIVECGCGGSSDATNAMSNKELAVITSISLDHTALLGKTIEEIARQKVGIVKNCPLVTGKQPPSVQEVFAPYHPVYAEEYEGKLSLRGDFQRYNAGIACKAAKLLGIGEEVIQRGLQKAFLRGRFEHLQTPSGTVILDGAHNEDAAKKLCSALKSEGVKEATFFVGMFADKAVDQVLSVLLPLAKKVVVLQAPLPRGMKAEELAKKAKSYCDEVILGTDEIIEKTLSEAGTKVVCGSFSILSEMRRWIDGQTKSRAGNP
ncbi:MAG: hypothetical protein J6D37_04590 [Clostridia bacterium]|nr:hypothetical protein [Clostridia bacterium]